MNLSVLIVEDNPDDVDQLIHCIKKIPHLIISKVISTANEALMEILQNQYDLVFLDLEMGETNNLDLLLAIPLPPTIIISAHPAYAIKTFDIDSVVDFIQKPITFPRLLRAIKRANKQALPIENRHIYLKVSRQMQQFDVKNIMYIEAYTIYSKVFQQDGSFVLVNDKISEIEKKIVNTRLLRLQKSYIFNLDYVNSFDNRSLVIDGKKFYVGIQYRGKLAHIFNIEDSST